MCLLAPKGGAQMASRQPIKSPTYLWQNRHGIYFFRARIPLPFQDHFGKVEFKRTLKTDSRREAIKLARAYRVKMDKELDKLKGIYSAYEVTLEAKTPHPTKQGEFITSKLTRPLSTPTEENVTRRPRSFRRLFVDNLGHWLNNRDIAVHIPC